MLNVNFRVFDLTNHIPEQPLTLLVIGLLCLCTLEDTFDWPIEAVNYPHRVEVTGLFWFMSHMIIC